MNSILTLLKNHGHMRKYKLNLLVLFLLLITTFSYSQQSSLSVRINKDTIVMDEVVTVEFLLDNLTGNFSAPDFMGFQVVSGPNTSSSFRMINGEVSQKKSYSYALVPVEKGNLVIGAASVENNGDVLSTEDIEVFVSDQYRSKNFETKDPTFIYDNDKSSGVKTSKKKRHLKKI